MGDLLGAGPAGRVKRASGVNWIRSKVAAAGYTARRTPQNGTRVGSYVLVYILTINRQRMVKIRRKAAHFYRWYVANKIGHTPFPSLFLSFRRSAGKKQVRGNKRISVTM